MKINSVTPNSALPDTPVMITGEGLDAASTLYFGDQSVPFKVSGTGNIEANVPDGSGTVEVTVADDGEKSNSVSFTYLKVY
ncbi:MAG: IPT/TIG domain-containing protein [Actinomycetota bacterium]|jgi:hypothetical protein|nr:IPT/TIG domain-containing protein [Actinomycetota bacterium]